MYGSPTNRDKRYSTLLESENTYSDEYCLAQCSLYVDCDRVEVTRTGTGTKMCALLYLDESGVMETDVFEKL